MDWLYVTAARIAPALASGLVVGGVAQSHAEVIALGAATAAAVVIEWLLRLRRVNKEGR